MDKAVFNGVPCTSLGMILTHKVIGPATPNTSYIEVPGRSGKIDVTDFVGLTYSNRIIEMTFWLEDMDRYSGNRRALEAMSGNRIRLAFDEDAGVYWMGRVAITRYERDNYNHCVVTLEMDADPFPYSVITDEEVRGV